MNGIVTPTYEGGALGRPAREPTLTPARAARAVATNPSRTRATLLTMFPIAARHDLVYKLGKYLGIIALTAGCTADAIEQTAGGESSSDTGDTSSETCGDPEAIHVDRAPIRRLTRFEYNNTVRDLLDDKTNPANALPSEEIGNGFGNDADAQGVSSLLVEQYNIVSNSVALRATADPKSLGRLAACAGEVSDSTSAAVEEACVRTWLESFIPRAYRRPLDAGEIDDFLALHKAIRVDADFPTSLAAMLEAMLQSPDFLYRVEHGTMDPKGRRRPSGHEMASRLSYFLWGTMPDATLRAAADSGELLTDAGVLAQATRMLDAPQARQMLRFFFDNLLPISGLAQLERDPEIYPTYSSKIGALMREETQRFLEHEIFEGGGTWVSALTADYTLMNGPLAQYYGVEGVEGDAFQKVPLDTAQRLGLLTQAGIVAGTIHSNMTNPVVRGSFFVQKMMCIKIPLPEGDILAQIKPPDPESGKTGRERFSRHSEDPVCQGCHSFMDPVGLALENYDAVGLWRDTENGVKIDASGSVPGTEGTIVGPVELVRKIAGAEQTHACFAANWLNFAYGRSLKYTDEACTQEDVKATFVASGYNIQTLLLELTQTDGFLYMPLDKE